MQAVTRARVTRLFNYYSSKMWFSHYQQELTLFNFILLFSFLILPLIYTVLSLPPQHRLHWIVIQQQVNSTNKVGNKIIGSTGRKSSVSIAYHHLFPVSFLPIYKVAKHFLWFHLPLFFYIPISLFSSDTRTWYEYTIIYLKFNFYPFHSLSYSAFSILKYFLNNFSRYFFYHIYIYF